MADHASRLVLADDLVRRLAATLRGAQLYMPGHPIVARNTDALLATLQLIHGSQPSVTLGVVGGEFIVGDAPVPRAAETLGDLIRRLRQSGIERMTIDRGVTVDEVSQLALALATPDLYPRAADGQPQLPSLPHIRLGRIELEHRVESSLADMATIRRLYTNAVNAANLVWDSAKSERQPDVTAARGMIDGLAQAVAQNRTALLALTALQKYDNYTFTHMVNVSILTMGQARGVGIEGGLLREFGLAALMHDIGKVKTPTDILNKPDKLTDDEYTILKRHVVDGAEILRRTPEMPTLAPVVAFEHHLRLDGTGYPEHVSRPQLNVGTMLCSIADVFDAMRSQRLYQQAFPTDRILEVLKRNDGKQFDQNLVRRFVQLVGIYPAGNLVRLDTGEIAVVLKPHAPDPYRPQVRVLLGRDHQPVLPPLNLNLWELRPEESRSIQAPVDPADYDIDPLLQL